VNPTICITDREGKSRRHDVMMHAKKKAKAVNINHADELKILMEQAALNWIHDEKRLSQWGVTLDCVPDIESYQQHASQKRNAQAIKFSSVNFQGLLTLTNPVLFLKKYKEGFGRAKSLGCGLMMIRKV
jgi:CRISPR system Cascade subunit CasE